MSLDPLLIGISARIYHPGTHGDLPGVFSKTLHYLEQSICHWVLASSTTMAVMVPGVTRDSLVRRSDLDLDDYARTLDGLLLQGGNDIAPQHYGEEPLRPDWAGDPVRDAYEMALTRAVLAAGKPVFGVCRGMQLLNVMHGGSLWQDIAEQRPESIDHRQTSYERHFHRIELVRGTRLAAMYPGVTQARVNSIHHQGVKVLAPGFVAEAHCPDDGMIEAIRKVDGPFVAAVQWHPEFHNPGDQDIFDDNPMLDAFLGACRAARRR